MTVDPAKVGEACSLTIDLDPGDRVDEGDWIASPGTAYEVTASRPSGPAAARRGERRQLRWNVRAIRHRLDEIPADARVIPFEWYER